MQQLLISAVAGAILLVLYLRQRNIQPDDVVGTQVSEECLNGILRRYWSQHNRSEGL